LSFKFFSDGPMCAGKRKPMQKRNEDIALLLEMSDLLAGHKNIAEGLREALLKVMHFLSMTGGRIYLMDKTGIRLSLVACHGVDSEGLEEMTIHEGFSGKAARTKAIVTQKVSELNDVDRAQMLFKKGFKSILCVPLIAKDKVRGVMNLGTDREIFIDQRKIDLLTAVGNQMAVATENLTLYEELQNKFQEIYEKKNFIKFFAYSISHDLKSPTIGLCGLTNRLNKKYAQMLDEKGRELCNQISKAAEQVLKLVEQINLYVTAKEAPFEMERVNLAILVEEIRKEFSLKLKKRKLKWVEPENLPEIVANRFSVAMVLRNFMDNALKYGGETLRKLKLGYEANDSFHVLSFTDDGIGIQQEDCETVFDSFKRNASSTGTTGSGLGLAIVKEIAEKHGGSAWAIPGKERGAVFHVSISKALEVSCSRLPKWIKS